MRRLGWLLGLALALCPLASEARAAAAAPTTGTIAPGCGTLAEFDRALDARLGDERARPPTALSIGRHGAGYVLSLQVGGERRVLRDPNCRELFRAAVVVAVAAAVSETRTDAREPEPATALEKRGTSRETAARSAGFGLGLAGGVHQGYTPVPALALELEARFSVARAAVGLALRYLAPGAEVDGSGRGVDVSAVGVLLTGSYAPSPAWEGRLGFGAFRLDGTGTGSVDDRSDYAWSAGPVVGASFYPLRYARFTAGLGVEGEWHVVRPAFRILDYGEVYRVSRFGGTALVRLRYGF